MKEKKIIKLSIPLWVLVLVLTIFVPLFIFTTYETVTCRTSVWATTHALKGDRTSIDTTSWMEACLIIGD